MNSKSAALIYSSLLSNKIVENILKINNHVDEFFIFIDHENTISHECAKKIQFIDKKINFFCCLDIKNWKQDYEGIHHRGSITKSLPNSTIHYWPTQLLFVAAVDFDHHTNDNKIFENLYLNKTKRFRPSRIQLLNSLNDNGLFDIGINTIADKQDETIKKIEGLSWESKLVSFDYGDYYDGGFVTKKYLNHNCLLEIVTETEDNYPRFTEKTWSPILNSRPFLILGGSKIHHELQNLGFLLYDEIFDYSFDHKTNIKDRINGIITNLNKLKKENKDKIYNILKKKIKFNYNLANKLIEKDNSLLDTFLSLSSEYDNLYYITDGDTIIPEMLKKQFETYNEIKNKIVYEHPFSISNIKRM